MMRITDGAALAVVAALTLTACGRDAERSGSGTPAVARSARIRALTVVQASGARPRFSPDGTRLVFDRLNADGFYDLYTSDVNGGSLTSLSEGRAGLAQRHNGNGLFDPSGRFIVFISEVDEHFASEFRAVGDPGIGLFSNLWATTPDARQLWRLTNITIKRTATDGVPSVATVNPVFSVDGRMLVWTERYAEGGGNWGRWRLKMADFVVDGGVPSLRNERVIFTPTQGNYVTAMGFLSAGRLVVSGNLDGQHEYGMDQYVLALDTGRVTNLTSTPQIWEEDSCIAPNGQIIYMTNIGSAFALDFSNPNWPAQPRTREYYLMNSDGGGKERLTYFNEAGAPEAVGRRVITAACDVSPDGRFLVGTQGIDSRTDQVAALTLRVIMIELASPLRATAPADFDASVQPGETAPVAGGVEVAVSGDAVWPWVDRLEQLRIAGEMRAISAQRDPLVPERVHTRFAQYHDGLPVFGGYAVRQSTASEVLTVFGRVYDGIALSIVPRLSAAEASAVAAPAAGASAATASQLGILPLEGRYVLAYRVVVRTPDDVAVVYVNAHTGAVEWQGSVLRGVAADPSHVVGQSARGGRVQAATPAGDNVRDSVLRVFEFAGQPARLAGFLATGRLEAADEASPSRSTDPIVNAAARAHTSVAEYLEHRFGRRGVDGDGSPMIAIVHPVEFDGRVQDGRRFALGAWYVGGGATVYGDGDRATVRPLAGAADVVAHQTAYALLDASAALGERGEAVELAEGFAGVLAAGIDLFAASAAADVDPWTLGEHAMSPAASLLQNRVTRAFYLATLGDAPALTATERAARAARMEQVFFRAHMLYLGPSASLRGARAASLQAAADLRLTDTDGMILRRAWERVGVQ